MTGSIRTAAVGAAVLALAACDADGTGPPRPGPGLEGVHVAGIPGNVLGAVVSARVETVDSLIVRFGPAGAALEAATPAVVPQLPDVRLPVLGLRPLTGYVLQVVAFGNGVVHGDTLAFTTGPLPDDLPVYAAYGHSPSPGYVALAAGPYGLVLDNDARVVWYHRFDPGPGLNFQAQPNGRYAARPPPASGSGSAPWTEIDPLGQETRKLDCVDGLIPRFHDLIAAADGSYWILCDETRTVDLSAVGGRDDTPVTGTAVQHVGPDGRAIFRWSPFDHLEVDPGPETTADTVNWTHGNALDLDGDGNLLVSFRNLSEVIKIDARTGAVLWRMGGSRNEFAFSGTPAPFARQHGLRTAGQGRLVLLDNLGDPGASRAERFVYDVAARTVRLEASFGSTPAVVAQLGGTTQPLPGGRTLVSFGTGARVEEYEADGTVVWGIATPGYVFRAQRILSLYAPGAGSPR